jgi:hypothetical protein
MTAHSFDLTAADLIAALTSVSAELDSSSARPPRAPAEDACRKLAAAIAIHDNDDALARRQALAACAAGRAAFWTTASYHSQKACALQLAAHSFPTLEAALDDAYGPGPGTDTQVAALDTLIPLNPPATAALALAYVRLGRWRDIQDLEARSVRHPPSSSNGHPAGSCDKKHAGYRLDAADDCRFHADVNGDSAARQERTSASGRTRGKT